MQLFATDIRKFQEFFREDWSSLRINKILLSMLNWLTREGGASDCTNEMQKEIAHLEQKLKQLGREKNNLERKLVRSKETNRRHHRDISALRARLSTFEPRALILQEFDQQRLADLDLRWRRFVNDPNRNVNPGELDQQFSLGCLAMRFRYATATSHSLRFAQYWRDFGRAPSELQVYLQEREFNGFHFEALSAIEAGCYALYTLAARLDPTLMPSANVTNVREITPRRCSRQLNENQPGSPLALFFQQLIAEPQFMLLTDIRNVSAHRAVIVRNLIVGQEDAQLVIPGRELEPLNQNFTEVLHAWVRNQLNEILVQAEILFVSHSI